MNGQKSRKRTNFWRTHESLLNAQKSGHTVFPSDTVRTIVSVWDLRLGTFSLRTFVDRKKTDEKVSKDWINW